jgi:hypothetical protein
VTTLAYDGRYLAADSQVTAGDIKLTSKKMFDLKTPEGVRMVVCGCGDWSRILAAISALQAGKKLPKGDYGLLAWAEGEGVSEFCGRSRYPADCYPQLALGSGAQAALGAMKAGATAGEAVAIAASIDISTGLPVLVFDTRSGRFVESAPRRKTTPKKGS